jgi:uncharacterized protein YdhG (YjbR/CyaY superfamily)
VFHKPALYQGTTSVLPKGAEKRRVLIPEGFGHGALDIDETHSWPLNEREVASADRGVNGMALKKSSPESGRTDVEAYLARVPEPARTTLEKVRAMIRAAAPKEATEAISYKIPSFQYKGALVWYAAFKKHCSFFPMDHSLEEEFAEELKDYKTSKGTIQFPVDKPLSKKLVTRIVKARVALNEMKALGQGAPPR